MSAYETNDMRGYHGEYVAQEPVSPLSPRSEAFLAQRSSAKQVSPLQSPSAPYPIPQRLAKPAGNFTLPPQAFVMPIRKPVRERLSSNSEEASAHRVTVSRPSSHDTVQSRPRSQSLRPQSELMAMPTGFLQDFTNHATADSVQQHTEAPPQDIPTGFLQDYSDQAPAKYILQQSQTAFHDTPTNRPRSRTLPSHIVEAELDAYRRRACAACGSRQQTTQQDFISCKKCTNVYYCTVECWDKRVCHSRPSGLDKKCSICGLQQAFATHTFEPCGKCLDVGKTVFFCSDSCWDRRNCHVRATTVQHPAVTPTQPSRIYHPGVRSQQQRRGYGSELKHNERRLTKKTQTFENFHPTQKTALAKMDQKRDVPGSIARSLGFRRGFFYQPSSSLSYLDLCLV